MILLLCYFRYYDFTPLLVLVLFCASVSSSIMIFSFKYFHLWFFISVFFVSSIYRTEQNRYSSSPIVNVKFRKKVLRMLCGNDVCCELFVQSPFSFCVCKLFWTSRGFPLCLPSVLDISEVCNVLFHYICALFCHSVHQDFQCTCVKYESMYVYRCTLH